MARLQPTSRRGRTAPQPRTTGTPGRRRPSTADIRWEDDVRAEADLGGAAMLRESTDDRSNGGTVTIGQFLGVLRRRAGYVLLFLLIGVLAAFAVLTTTPKSYQAQAVVDISPLLATGDVDTSKTLSTVTESNVVTSTSVSTLAAKTLQYTKSTDDLAQHVKVSSPLNSQVLVITFTSATAQGAADGANAFANAYLAYRTQTGQAQLAARIKALSAALVPLQKALSAIPPPPTTPSTADPQQVQRSGLQSEISTLSNQLNAFRSTVVIPGRVAGVAIKPTAPSAPNPILYLAGGLLIGLLAGIVVAVIRDRRDDRIRGSADLEQTLAAPVLAAVPATRRDRRGAQRPLTVQSTGPQADAYRRIATKLDGPAIGQGARSVLLVGCATRESTAPFALATTFASQALVTALVAPRAALRLVAAIAEPDGESVDVTTPMRARLEPSEEVPGLYLVSLGDEITLDWTLRTHPSAFEDVLRSVDILVIDGVNLMLASSMLTLGRLAHTAVVVADDRRTKRADLRRAERELSQVGASVVGSLLVSRRRWFTLRRALPHGVVSRTASTSVPASDRDRSDAIATVEMPPPTGESDRAVEDRTDDGSPSADVADSDMDTPGPDDDSEPEASTADGSDGSPDRESATAARDR